MSTIYLWLTIINYVCFAPQLLTRQNKLPANNRPDLLLQAGAAWNVEAQRQRELRCSSISGTTGCEGLASDCDGVSTGGAS